MFSQHGLKGGMLHSTW